MTRNILVSIARTFLSRSLTKDTADRDFLAIALEAYWRHGTPLQVTLPLCERVRQSLAKATHIWEAYLKNGRNVTINQCLEFQDEWTKRVDQGEFSMGHMAKPAALD